MREEVSTTTGKTGAAFINTRKVLNEYSMSLRTKLKLFNSKTLSIWVYGSAALKNLSEI